MSSRLILTLSVAAAVIVAATLFDAHLAPPPPKPVVPAVIIPTPPAPEPAPALPPLTQVTIKDSPIHAPPEDTPLPVDKNGVPVPERHVSDEVANGPRQLPTLPPTPKQFSGAPMVTGPVTLQIGQTRISLFGVKPALVTDRCGPTRSNCAELAQQALQNALGGGGTVACHTPNPNGSGIVAYAICLNPIGLDLGGVLICEGLALADTGQSYDYVGAENVAKSQKRGLWQNR